MISARLARILMVFTTAATIAAAPVGTPASFKAAIGQAKEQMMANPAAALRQAQTAQALAEREPIGDDRNQDIATAEWLQAEAAIRTNDASAAAPLIERALQRIATARRTKLFGDLLMARGGVEADGAQVAAALADYQAAHNVFRDLKETRSQSIALVAIGTLYQAADDYDNALKYYSRALDVFSADPMLALTITSNRGASLKELKRYPAAQVEYERALAMARKLQVPSLEATIYRNLARLAADQNDYAAADRMIAHGLTVANASGNAGSSRPQFQAIAAEVALRRNDPFKARALIERSFFGVDLATTDLGYREAHYTAYSVYAKLGEKERALAHLQAMKRLDDQVWKLSASTNTALMAARFDSANQEARISKLKADDAARQLAMAQAETRFTRIIFGGLAVGAAIVLALLGFGLWQSRRARIRLSASNSALEKALAAKTEFLATTSHEIRTPLNGILGMTQVMLADPKLDAASRDRVGIVHGAGLTMRSLVDDILDVAKMETGNLTVEARPFDLKAMLEDVTRMWGEQARAKGLEFRLELADCPRGLVGDAGRVRQVVYNLLSNAVKFTASGSVTVRASCGGDCLRIVVADTGIGIAADKHAEIFESFKQADGGTTRQFGGTGLGLAIVKNIATAMDGAVTVESAPDEGATFTVELPFVAAEVAVPEPVAAGGGLLIVDRNPIARAMLKAVLEPRAGKVCFAGSVGEAIETIGRGGVARVLIDQATVGADGADPFAGVAGIAQAADVPVAVLWTDPNETVRDALERAGVAQVVAKPIAGPALASALYACNTVESVVTQAA